MIKRLRKETQASKLERARALIDRYPLEVAFSAEDLAQLSDLTATDLRFAVRRRNPQFPNDKRHLHVLAYDWTTPDQFSWLAAVKVASAKNPDEARISRRRGKLLFALRFAVKADMDDFRSAQDPQKCSLCPNTEFLGTDHVAPAFIRIALEFLEWKGDLLQLRQVQGCGDLLADVDMEADWIAFHAKRAVYQLLCRSCNSSKGDRDPRAGG